jgi:polysaccharide biosynthesis/export protein
MGSRAAVNSSLWSLLALALVASASGCRTVEFRNRLIEAEMPPAAMPTELNKISLPPYVVEPPDILLIDAVKVVPKSPYNIEPFDQLQVLVDGAPPENPIAGIFRVEANGTISLGPLYGSVKVVDMTLEEATEAVNKQLRGVLRAPQAAVSLAESAGKQRIEGEHLVTPDGTVNLGSYGNVYVAGMTVAAVKGAIEEHLTQYLEDPEVSVDVFSYNSKRYYVITEGAGLGEGVNTFPVTGNETVLDAISQIQGLRQVSSKTIWIARPAPDGAGCDQILPVNWREITRGGATATNYQILPGDRVFIAEDKMLAFDTLVNKALQPFERMIGFTLLGTQTIQQVNRFPQGFGSGGINQFF